MGGLDKTKDSVEPKDTKSLPVVTVRAEYKGPQFLDARAYDESGNELDTHIHSSEGWLLNDWGFREHSNYTGDDGFTHFDGPRQTYHWERIYEKLKQPFILRYHEHQVEVTDLVSNNPEASAELSNPPKDMNTSKSLKGILLKFLEDNDGLWDQFMEGDDPDPEKYDEMTDKALNDAVAAIVEAVEGLYGDSDGLREFASTGNNQVVTPSVLKYPAEPLLRKSEPVNFYEALGIIKLLREACKQQTWGEVVGMAAPQIGINKRVFVALDKAYINPVYVRRSKHTTECEEGCYSLSEEKFDYLVKRRSNLVLKWLDEYGNENQQYFAGLEAQVIQHEFDHLDGKLIGNDLVATGKEARNG